MKNYEEGKKGPQLPFRVFQMKQNGVSRSIGVPLGGVQYRILRLFQKVEFAGFLFLAPFFRFRFVFEERTMTGAKKTLQ